MAKKGSGVSIDFVGASELLRKIEAAGGDVEKALARAAVKSLKPAGLDMMRFAQSHKVSGDTWKSAGQTNENKDFKNGYALFEVGFLRPLGEAAIFLEYGTPTQTPHFFIHNIYMQNADDIQRIQREALTEIFKELL